MDKFGVEDTVFYEVDITTFYNCTRSLLQTAKFEHMNGHWKDYIPVIFSNLQYTVWFKQDFLMLIGSWWRLEWYIMHSRIISQISPTFGKIPRKFPEKFGNLVQISGIQSKFREFSQDFGNLNWIFQWILRTFQWFEHYSKTLKYYWILQFTEILWNSSDSHWNSQPRL